MISPHRLPLNHPPDIQVVVLNNEFVVQNKNTFEVLYTGTREDCIEFRNKCK